MQNCCFYLGLALTCLTSAAYGQSQISLRPASSDAKGPPATFVARSQTDRPNGYELIGTPGLSLAELEGMAMANHPALRQAASEVDAARGRWLQVGLKPNPVAGYLANEVGNEGKAGQQGAFVGQEFVTAGKLRLNRAAASQAVAEAQQRLEAQRYRVLNEVRIRFYSMLVAQRGVELADELARISGQGVKAANDLLMAKEVSRVDVVQAEIEAGSAAIQLQNARNRYAAAWRQLAAAVAVPALEPTPLVGDLSAASIELSWEGALDRLLIQSPELAEARAAVARADWLLRRARAEPIPNVDVQLSGGYDNASRDTIANIQVGIPVPVFNRNQGGIRQAAAEFAAAQAQVRRLELDLTHRLASAFERYANARQQVQRYSGELLPKAKESLDLVTAGYRQGEFGFLVVLTAQRTFFQTNIALLDAQRDLWETQVSIEGLLLTRDTDPAVQPATGRNRTN